MPGSKDTNETLAATPDALLKTGDDARIELSEEELKRVSAGTKQMQDMTNNQQTTAQKAAEKADSYIRS